MNLLLAFFLTLGAFAQQKLIQGELYARRGEYRPLPDFFTPQEMNQVFFSESRLYQEELKKVKYLLLNGELAVAKALLKKLTYGQPKLRPVALRYSGMIAFIEQDYEKTLQFLTAPELRDQPHYARVCTLVVLSQVILGQNKNLESNWDRCQMEAKKDLNAPNLVWLDTLVKLRLIPRPGITREPFLKLNLQALDVPDLKILLKLALFLNQEKMVVEKLPTLLPEQLEDREVRELAGHIFFRAGQFANAYRFVEDLRTPNSETIKANLLLLREKYEVAYAQLKLALNEKQNSQNALERLVPTAWLLGDWRGGANYARQLAARTDSEAGKLTIMAAFEMQTGDYEAARALLRRVRQESRRGSSLEVNQIGSFSALMENKPEELEGHAAKACELYDIVNCWVLYQLPHWEGFPLVIRRGDKIPVKENWPELTRGKIEGKLTEPVYVFQQDIEELDDREIKLIK